MSIYPSSLARRGIERVVRGYLETLHDSALWMVVPYEEQAYQFTYPELRQDRHDSFPGSALNGTAGFFGRAG